MFDFFYSMTDTQVLVLLSCISVPVSILAILLVRYILPVKLRYRDNGVVGNISALIGIIYGVLAGLTALYLINNINYTTDAVQREANSLANLYRDSLLIQGSSQTEIQTEIKNYLNEAITIEWPLMKSGKKLNVDGEIILTNLHKDIYAYSRANPTDNLLSQDMLTEVKALYNAREQRIHMSNSQLDYQMWIVILIGTFLTLAVNFFFKMDFILHVIVSSAAALMAAAIIYLLVTLDRPFQGEFVVDSDVFKSLLVFMEKSGKPSNRASLERLINKL